MQKREMRDFFEVAAPFYDADYESLHYEADIGFWVGLAQEAGGPVLEMGCGSGRVLLPTARAGVTIHGLDLSSAMLAELRRKLEGEPAEVRGRVTLSEGDMCTADAGRGFALVTAPFRVVQALLTRGDQRAWLRNVRRHLAPGGAVCFDVFQPRYDLLAAPLKDAVDVDRTDPATGVRTRRFATVTPRNEFQTMRIDFRWLVEDASGARISETGGRVDLRWYTHSELENLLELEKFRILDDWGSFQREPFGEGSREQIIRAMSDVRRRDPARRARRRPGPRP